MIVDLMEQLEYARFDSNQDKEHILFDHREVLFVHFRCRINVHAMEMNNRRQVSNRMGQSKHVK
jgi:hypothetical protein